MFHANYTTVFTLQYNGTSWIAISSPSIVSASGATYGIPYIALPNSGGSINAYSPVVANTQGFSGGEGFTGNIASSASPSFLYAVGATAEPFIRINAYLCVTTAASTSSTLPAVWLSYTDFATSSIFNWQVTPTNSGNTVGTCQQGSAFIVTGRGTNVNYYTMGYASSGATPMAYEIWLVGEQMP